MECVQHSDMKQQMCLEQQQHHCHLLQQIASRRRTNIDEISVSRFGPHWTQKIRQSEALFSGQYWFSSDIVLVFGIVLVFTL